MEGSPFNRSALTRRSPPPTPSCCSPPPPVTRPPETKPSRQEDQPIEVLSKAEIQKWMTSIEQCLRDVCTISSEGKLNADQKLRIQSLCRNVGHGTSQMAVQYQSLKQKAIHAHSTIQGLKEKNDLARQIHQLSESIEESFNKPSTKESSVPNIRTSFADMVKKSGQNYIRPEKVSSLVIYPTDTLKSSEETKTLVQNIIRPEELKLHVRGLRKTKNGGVIISTDTKADIEKLKQSSKLTTSGLMVDEPCKRKPRIVIIGVPSFMQEKEVFSCIYHQNLADSVQDMTIELFLNSIKLSDKSGRKDAESCNYIIEVTAQIRKALITKDRLFVNWSSCPIRDFTLVTRCYRCQQYGHAAKTCRAEANTCGHCGELGHAMKDCTKKTESPKCATCLHFKKPCNHKTGDNDCPAKIIAEKRYLNSVDYDVP